MKKLIFSLILAMSFASCSTASADIILKYGMVGSDTREDNIVTWAGIWGETDNCDYCAALFVVETYNNSETPRDRLVGVDYVIKGLENKSGVIRTNLGFAVSDEGLQGGEVFNFHFGLSMTAKKCIGSLSCSLNYDHFSNGKTLFNRDHIAVNVPLDLVSIAIGF